MERVAQLLDDLDDLLSAVPLLWERIRRALLQVGLAAAVGMPLAELLAFRWAVALATLALAISCGWLVALAVHEVNRIRRQRMATVG